MISAKEETGFEEFKKAIEKMFLNGEIRGDGEEVVITNVRHKSALEDALQSIKIVMDGIEHCMPEDFLTIDLMDAYRKLGIIIGEAVEDDLINEIFGKFCMGK